MTSWLVGAIPALVAVFTVVLFASGYRLMTTEPELDLDDAEVLYLLSQKDTSTKPSMFDRLGLKLAPYLRSVLPASALRWIQRQVDMAGRPDGLDVDQVLARVARWGVILGPLVLFYFLRGNLFFVLVGVAGMVILPLAGVSGSARKRREQIDRDLPDFLDVLAVTVSAGLAFRTALATVAHRFGGPLAEEIQTVLNQVANGATLRAAFTGMRERTQSEAIDEFVTAYLQAEELGAPLVETLNQIAVEMRRANAQRLRQLAGRVEPRVSLVLTMVLIPGAMVILIGGMIIALDVGSLTGMFGG